MGARSKALSAIALAPLLLLAAAGAAFAQWEDTVRVSGSATLGVFNVKFADVTVSDNEPQGKDVATVTANIKDEDLTINNASDDPYDGGAGDLISFTVSNAYPGYQATITVTIENAGSIPAKLSKAEIQVSSTDLTNTELGYITIKILDTQGNEVYSSAAYQLTNPATINNFPVASLGAGSQATFQIVIEIAQNAPETMMGDRFDVELRLTYVQSVP